MMTRKTKTMAPTRPHKMLTRWFSCSVLKKKNIDKLYTFGIFSSHSHYTLGLNPNQQLNLSFFHPCHFFLPVLLG